jgi:hypothetical protein
VNGKRSVQIYHIRFEGQLDDGWSAWFPGLVITPGPDGTTSLCGAVEDQGVLHGILARARDLNVKLLSVEAAPGGSGVGECRICRTLYGGLQTEKEEGGS